MDFSRVYVCTIRRQRDISIGRARAEFYKRTRIYRRIMGRGSWTGCARAFDNVYDRLYASFIVSGSWLRVL